MRERPSERAANAHVSRSSFLTIARTIRFLPWGPILAKMTRDAHQASDVAPERSRPWSQAKTSIPLGAGSGKGFPHSEQVARSRALHSRQFGHASRIGQRRERRKPT